MSLEVYYVVEEKLLGEWIPLSHYNNRPIKHPTEISAIGERIWAEKQMPNSWQFRIVRKTKEQIDETV